MIANLAFDSTHELTNFTNFTNLCVDNFFLILKTVNT